MSYVRELISKASLRGYAVFLFLTVFAGIVVYIFVRSDIKFTVAGSLDINTVIVAFVGIVSTITAWLFSRRREEVE
ncbi:MAG: hypothetical protein QW734_04650 [Candidatus Bathyarchaeia archaeon]